MNPTKNKMVKTILPGLMSTVNAPDVMNGYILTYRVLYCTVNMQELSRHCVITEPEMIVRHRTITDQITVCPTPTKRSPGKQGQHLAMQIFANYYCQGKKYIFSCDKQLHVLLRTCSLENILLISLF